MGRTVILRAVALCAVLASLPMLALGEDVAQRKESAVRTALEKQGKTGDYAELVASSARAAAITDVKMGGTLGAPEVTVSTDGRPAYEWFKMDGGKRIVIDFHNTIHLQSGLKLAPIGAAPLIRVRTSLYSLDPEFVTRIVIDLQRAAQPEFSQEDTKVTMRLRKTAADEANASLSNKAMVVGTNLAQAQQKIESEKQRLTEAVQRAVLAEPPAELVNDEIRAALADASARASKTTEHINAAFESARTPFETQRSRLDELQAGLFGKTIDAEKASTTLKSIEKEIESAADKANKEFAGIETEFGEAIDVHARQYDALIASAKGAQEKAPEAATIELAKADAPTERAPTAAEPAPVVPEIAPVVSTLEPDKTETVASSIEKIERDLADIRGEEQAAMTEPVSIDAPVIEPATEPIHVDVAEISPQDANESAPTLVEAPVIVTPTSDAVLAKLDGLNADMSRLAEAIASATEAPVDPATGLETTTAVAVNIVPVLDAVDAAPLPVNSATINERADAAIVVAQATETPEPVAAEPAQEETPAAEPGATEESATASEPAATADPAPPADAPADGAAPAPAETSGEAPAVVEEPDAAPAQPVKVIAAAVPAERETLPPGVDPLDQIVNIDFREMDLSSVVSLLAKKGQVNVIAGTEVTGTVTADIRNVPLRKAMDMVLRMNGLGIVEEEGIFRIVTYDEAVAARRTTKMVPLTNAQAEDVRTTLEGILVGGRDAKLVSVSANKNTNVLIISGPEDRAAEFERLARELDVKEPTLPTVTEAIKLNYLDPTSAKPIAETLKSEKIGKVEIDKEGRHVVVTDIPAAVEQMKQLLASVDKPVKQVAIEAMIVDAVLRDASQTGVDWTIDAIRRHSTNGDLVSDLSQLTFDGNLGPVGTTNLDAGVLQLGILSSEVRLNATIAAEVQSRNAQILASPSIVTVENQPATISIVQEFPYQEITQGLTGPPVASTEFKPIGVTLDVTPRITHTNDTIVLIQAKQSSVSGLTETGVPIEDKREAQTTLRAQDGRTIFIGGLRNTSNVLNVNKIPVLGDIPVLNFMFRNTNAEKQNTELLIFLTCRVMDQELPELTVTQQEEFDKLDATPKVPDGQRANFHDILRPQDMRDPMWKWRRSNR
ncbi:MAG: AMIN domain-containing protein [Candidatus Hydrogenedentes bacterium]|nr:AMIN domain-containing protein [Candidatus Hydrogenedentota bacterium]